MEPTKHLGDRTRIARAVLAVGLAVSALLSLRQGRRLRGGLAGLGAFALGYTTMTGFGDVTEAPSADSDTEPATVSGQLHCAICGDAIVPGQGRRPNENGETVHEACLAATA